MTTERFIIFLLLGALAWVYFYGPALPEPQRSSQSAPIVVVQPTAVPEYTIDTSQPATVRIVQPTWAAPTATATVVPQLTSGNDATPEPQRSEQGNERGANSRRDD